MFHIQKHYCAKLVRIDDRYIHNSFDKKMNNCIIGYLSFNNGIWDFKNKAFKSLDCGTPETHAS